LSVLATTVLPPTDRTVSSKRIVTFAGGLARTARSSGVVETRRAWAHADGAPTATAASAVAAASVVFHRVKVSSGTFGQRPKTVRRQSILPA
jgi:hypothetical protein